MDRLLTLEVFVRVAEMRSFSRAADALGLPRSTLSTAVRELETRLGTRLINRTTRSMSLTADGLAYRDWCVRLLADIEATDGAMAADTSRPAGRLRVDVPARVARRIVCPALPDFLERHPDIELRLGVGDRPVDLARDGVDCAIRIGALTDSGLVARPIGLLRTANFASAAYLERHGAPTGIDDLERHAVIGFASTLDDRSAARWWYASGGADTSIAVRASVTVDDADSYIACGRAGLGLIQLPAYDVADPVARGELVEVLPDLAPAPMPVTALLPERRHTSARVRVFVEWIRELYEQRMRKA